MMYSEFLDKTGFTENYISHQLYTDFIEPCYMTSSLDQKQFCKSFYKLHTDLVVSAVELLMRAVKIDVLEDYVFNDEEPEQIIEIRDIQNRLLQGFLINVKNLKYKKLL